MVPATGLDRMDQSTVVMTSPGFAQVTKLAPFTVAAPDNTKLSATGALAPEMSQPSTVPSYGPLLKSTSADAWGAS